MIRFSVSSAALLIIYSVSSLSMAFLSSVMGVLIWPTTLPPCWMLHPFAFISPSIVSVTPFGTTMTVSGALMVALSGTITSRLRV